MAVSSAERRFLLSQVNSLATEDLDRLWSQAVQRSDVDFQRFLMDAYPDLLDPYIQMSADLAATWFELSDPSSNYVARTAPPPPREKFRVSVDWALGALGSEGLKRLRATTQRAVFDGARNTTLLNVDLTDSTWARVAHAGACEFCKLLATRRNVYTSRETAARDVHNDCICHPIEVRGQQDWRDLVDARYAEQIDQWEREYLKARAEAGNGSSTQILAAWRRLDAGNAT
ncbi:hypothetical protein PXH78_26925 [Mycolicibacterium smegmatis]|uniref:VG15 protein n=1 Tax=Mycolicibacterium smegmatis TaxID=1772 RepID=UPI0005D7D3A5|nr:hypothetical protein [Mycolicibacterium smegmatis]MDF1902746.1 hypothetical protein [Mycolicibacterium smegmatis]MDF1909022.1 hypothetical protein [Mycolicibacterium smegmatis]MDF1921241.1 hypothetical protein [Mycolicibacterium smegmatis]MDF1927506.1 hypothetical protein [Mycolicibacterium smegmatis]UAK53363.1 hypothetical protein K8P01_22485 [Mycolicibacterium smegmatis]